MKLNEQRLDNERTLGIQLYRVTFSLVQCRIYKDEVFTLYFLSTQFSCRQAHKLMRWQFVVVKYHNDSCIDAYRAHAVHVLASNLLWATTHTIRSG